MRKAALLGLAAFYLMLTTGMFVCIVHCTAKKVFSHHQEMAGMAKPHHDEHSKKHCKGGKGCSCCDQHGTYVVKENIKPSVEHLQFQQVLSAVLIPVYHHHFSSSVDSRINLWTDSHAPPGPSGKDYLIRIRTLLI